MILNLGAFFVADYVAFLTYKVLLRKRLWQWAKSRFNSWDEFQKWWESTSASDIEQLLANEADWDEV